MMETLRSVKVPGVVWVILLLILGILIQANSAWIEQNLHVPPMVVAGVVSAIFLVVKRMNPGTADLNTAIDLIEKLLAQLKATPPTEPTVGMRSAHMERAELNEEVAYTMPSRPNDWASVLWG